jgi:hypothetical protein
VAGEPGAVFVVKRNDAPALSIMPNLSLSLNAEGVAKLLKFLSDEPEIAFIVSVGPDKWRAVNRVTSLPDGKHAIWHDPGGPLPRFNSRGQPVGVVGNPWRGWTAHRPGDQTVPFFGDCHCVFHLELHAEGVVPGRPGNTSISWIGAHYWRLGKRPLPTTTRCWKRMKRWIEKELRERFAR